MALKEYEVRSLHGRVETMLLSEAEAERLHAKPVGTAQAVVEQSSANGQVAAKVRKPRNKAVTVQSKTAE